MPNPLSFVPALGRRCVTVVIVAAMVATSLTTVALVGDVAPASAANDGSLEFSKSGPASVLYGENVTYTLSATNNGTGADGFNLTFRDVLPAGAVFVSSSVGNPTVFDDAPLAGQTTLLFENVADLQAGVTESIEVVVDLSEATYPVGTSVTNEGGAYMSGDARLIPDFDSTGAHVDNGDTSAFATASVITDVEAIQLTKSEPNAESELLRGVHTEWTTYGLLVENNLVNPTDSIVVEDWIPAGLEFLGCGSVDQTDGTPASNLTGAATEEYVGSGALGVGVAPVDPTPANGVAATCLAPTTVETVTLAADEEFMGQAAGVYTHVVWNVPGALAASGATEIMYAAGIPLRENTATFDNGSVNVDHTADLDNNNGPYTTDEQELTNWARATGNYNPGVDDLSTSSEDSSTVTAEDLSIHKGVDDSEFLQGELPRWTMLIETGEYRAATGVVVTDTLPDGQCPVLAAGDPESPDFTGECTGVPGDNPTVDGVVDDPDTATENADGTWTIVWTTIPDLGLNDDYTIEFSSVVRDFYQESFVDATPVVGADAFTNTVAIEATTAPISDGGTDLDRVTETTPDASSAGQTSAVVEINKSVSQPTAPGVVLDCDAATWTTEDPPTPDVAGLAYRPGDRVCYRIQVNFIGDLDFRNPRVTDFIPPNTTFEQMWGLDAFGATAANDATIDAVYDLSTGPGTAPSTSTTEGLEWTLGVDDGSGDLYVDEDADTFEVIFSVTIDDDPRDATSVDIFDNLAQLTIQNNPTSGGVTFASRDQAGYPHVEPNISLDKRNQLTAGATDDDPETGTQGDTVLYEVDITNDFEDLGGANAYATAFAIEFWDILPDGITCGDLSAGPALSVPGSVTCLDDGDVGYPLGGQVTAGRSVLEGTITSLAPQATGTISYEVDLPADAAAGDSYVNDAGVRSYGGSVSNTGGAAPAYYPENNIDEDNVPLENTAAADDTATVNIPGVIATKVQGSGAGDASGNTNRSNSPQSTSTQDAAIGETVSYTFGITIPEGTDLYDATIADDLDAEIDFVAFTGGSFSLDNGTTTIPLTINVAGDDAYFDIDGSTTENAADILVDYDAGGDDVDVTFPAVWNNAGGTLDDLLSVSFDTIVVDAPGNVINDNIDNSIDVDWDDADGDAQTTVTTPNVRTKVVEPDPVIVKTDDGTDTDVPTDGQSNVAPGDSVTYTLTITNPADGANPAHVSAAYDLVVTDVLPDGVTFVPGNVADNPDGGTFTPATPVGAEGTITWTQAEVAALAALQVGGTITISYTVTIDDPAIASSTLTNTATVTAESLEADTADERTTYTDDDTDTVELPVAALVKDVQPFDSDPFDGSDTDTTSYAVGEPIDFRVTLAVVEGTQAYDLTAFDTLPAFLEFESYASAIDISAECERIGGGAISPSDVIALTPDGQTLGWYLGDVLANGGDCLVTLPYTVHVDSVADTSTSGSNAATLSWNQSDDITADPTDVTDVSGTTFDEGAGPVTETVDVVEPLLAIDKDVQVLPGPAACEASADLDECETTVGTVHRFTVTVTNTGDGPAHDVVVVDTLPTDGTGAPTNFTGTPTGVYAAGPRTITWNVAGPIAAGGGSVTFTYDVTVGTSADITDDEVLTNTAAVTSYWGLSETDRETGGGALINPDVPEYHVDRNPVTPDDVELTVEFPDLVIQKTPAAGMDDTDARVGEDFRWRLEVFNDGDVAAFDVDVTDTLPTGWLYELGSAQIDTGAGFVALGDPTGGTAGPLVWTDVVATLAGNSSFVIEFDTQPQASLLTLATTGTFDHENDSAVTGDDATGESGNGTGDYGDDNGAPDGPRGSDDDTARIRRVDLEIDKSIVESAPYFFGDFITYRLVVTNDDSVVAVDAATGVTVRDVLPAGVVFDSAVSANGTYSDTTDIWTLTDPLAAGASATLDIVVRINSSTAITNIAEIETTDQWDIDSTPGDHDDGTGPDEDDNDDVSFTPTNADLGNRLWFDIDADGEQDAGEPGIPGVDVTVSWIDPGDGSTQSQTVTTNADGEYFFTGLPQDIDLTVTVDTADLPAGLTQTFELEDDPDITDTQANNAEVGGSEDGVVTQIELTGTNPSYLDVDFGYTGTGSIGDFVWYDLNQDGVQDGDEVGLDGIDITVEWAGFDGVLGDDPSTPGVDESLDDVTYTTTTAGGGMYSVGNLPAGSYTVTVDETDLPNGIDIATWDPEFDTSGDPADLGGVSTYDLGAGEDWDGVDFGYVGPGRLGDTVWIDLDGDGVQDPGEVGIPNVTVTLEFVEPGGATTTLMVDTDANGNYEFDGLPLDIPMTVTIDPADLPGNMEQTHDIDDPADGSSVAGTPDEATVTLTTADPENLDVDFGYRGLGTIGDTIWLDLDGSGETTPQADDIRLPNVEVTLTYTNPGGDDLVLVTTTDADGMYLFENLPDGDYTVTVNPATLPAGVTPIVDPDGGADNTSSLTLDDDPGTVGVNEGIDLDQDFAYVGTGSIGDLVWNDVDELGVVDAGELGIPGVTVTAVWTDPVTGATTTLTTVTDADGEYLFESLPAGDYVVTIDPTTLPEGMAPTYDLDGEDDGARQIEVTLGDGEDRRDVDFGERREADLRITKASMGEWAVGAEERWTITVTNDGPAIADGTITVTDTVPDGVTPLRHVGDDWTCTIAGQSVTCTLVASPLAVDASSSFDLVVEVGAGAAPGVTNIARVSQDGGPVDPDPDNDTDDDSVVIPLAVLGVEKALVGELVTGEEATWRITVTNYGPSSTTTAYTVVDDLPETLDHVRTEGDGWTCSVADSVVTCERSVVLAVGETASVDIVTLVDAAPGVQIANGATVGGGTSVDGEPLDEDVIDEISTPGSEAGEDLDLPDGVTPETSTPDIPVLAFTGISFARLMSLALVLLAGGAAFVLLGARRGRDEEVGSLTAT